MPAASTCINRQGITKPMGLEKPPLIAVVRELGTNAGCREPALGHYLLDIAVAKGEAIIQPYAAYSHDVFINVLISPGEANITDARSPRIPAPTIAGLPVAGPSALESVLNRRLNSQNLRTWPSAVVTK